MAFFFTLALTEHCADGKAGAKAQTCDTRSFQDVLIPTKLPNSLEGLYSLLASHGSKGYIMVVDKLIVSVSPNFDHN